MTVTRIEASDGRIAVRDQSAKAVRLALENAGVEFVLAAAVEPGCAPADGPTE